MNKRNFKTLILIVIVFFTIFLLFLTNNLLSKKSTKKLQMLNSYSLEGEHPTPDPRYKHE